VILARPGKLPKSRYAEVPVEGVDSMLDIDSQKRDLEELTEV